MHRITGKGGEDSLIEMSPTDSYNGEWSNFPVLCPFLWPRSHCFCHLNKYCPMRKITTWKWKSLKLCSILGELVYRYETENHQVNGCPPKGGGKLKLYCDHNVDFLS